MDVIALVGPSGTGKSHRALWVARKNGSELLLPYIKDCILEVNPKEGFLKVHLMEGLI